MTVQVDTTTVDEQLFKYGDKEGSTRIIKALEEAISRQKWKLDIYDRLTQAEVWFAERHSNLSGARKASCSAFRTFVSGHTEYEAELKDISVLGIQLLAIFATLKQLERDLSFIGPQAHKALTLIPSPRLATLVNDFADATKSSSDSSLSAHSLISEKLRRQVNKGRSFAKLYTKHEEASKNGISVNGTPKQADSDCSDTDVRVTLDGSPLTSSSSSPRACRSPLLSTREAARESPKRITDSAGPAHRPNKVPRMDSPAVDDSCVVRWSSPASAFYHMRPEGIGLHIRPAGHAPQNLLSACDSTRPSSGISTYTHRASSLWFPSPQFQLAMPRTIPDTAQSIIFALKGDIDGLKDLFSRGLAFPRDVSSSRRWSLIRWTLYGGMGNHETVRFLVAQGAPIDEDSYDHVYDFTLRGKCNQMEFEGLKCIRQSEERDWIAEQNFPLIHKIILGICYDKRLIDELKENPDAINATDAQGRTALDWATAKARLDDMKLLIKQGSNIDTMDVKGRTTVLHAVDSHNDEVLRILLKAGANPNPRLPKGLFRSSPLKAASFGSLTEMTKLLLEYGAEINTENPEGQTALHAAASTQNAVCAALLLESGASPEYVSRNGYTPLMTAISNNSHAVLQLFVQWCDNNVTTACIEGSRVLPIIAEHADAKTMSLIESSWPMKVSLQLVQDDFAAVRETLQSRQDFNRELRLAFESLLLSINMAGMEPPGCVTGYPSPRDDL